MSFADSSHIKDMTENSRADNTLDGKEVNHLEDHTQPIKDVGDNNNSLVKTEVNVDDVDASCSDSETESVDIEEFIPSPPDGGYGWVVVFCSFMLQFIVDGISYAFGAFLRVYVEAFNCTMSEASTLMSCLLGCYMLSAPIASALINKYGCRPVGIAGSLIAAVACILSTFSTSIQTMILSFGVLGGIGFGLMYMPAVLCPSIYFDKKRSIAIGIGMCGSGVGALTFGPVGKILLDALDWKGAHYVFAGIILNGVIFSGLVRPLLSEYDVKKMKALKRAEKVSDGSKKAVRPDNHLTNSHLSIHVYHSTNHLDSQQKVSTELTVEEAANLKRPLHRKDAFYSGSIHNLSEYKESTNIRDYTLSVISIPARQEDVTAQTGGCKCLPQSFKDSLTAMLDFRLLLDLKFNIIAILCFFIMLAYLIPFAFTTARAESLGVSKEQSPYLIFIIGLGTTLGRPTANTIAQIPCVKAIHVHNIFLLVAGIACVVAPFCMTFTTMAVSTFCYGFFVGGHVSLSPIVMVDFLGLDKLTSAFGLLTLVRGVSTLAGPPLGGGLYDYMGSYDSVFYIAGSLIIATAIGFCSFELPCLKGTSDGNQEKAAV